MIHIYEVMKWLNKIFGFITKDSIIHTFTTIGSFFLLPNYNLLFKMLTLDSLFTSINFFKVFVNQNITESVIINKTSTLYNGFLLDRYIYYIIQYLLYNIICNTFWCTDIDFVYFIILLSTIPEIINKILISDLFNVIRKKKEDIIKLIIAKQCTNLIKFFSKTYLNKDISIKHKEILVLFDDYQKTINYSIDVLKNAGLIIAFTYIKNSYPNFYYRVTKYVYTYKTGGELLTSFNKETATKMLNDIVENKKWSELTKPNVYSAIIYLYQINQEKSDTLYRLITFTKYKFLEVCAIWGVISVSKQIFIAPPLSLAMLIYKKQLNYYNFLILIMCIFIGYFTESYFLTSFVCQFGYALLFNDKTYAIIRFLYKQSKKKLYIIHQRNNNIFLPLIFMFIEIASFSCMQNMQTFIMLLIHILYMFVDSNNLKNLIVYFILLFMSSLSDFNILHLIFNIITTYFTIGLISDRVIISIFHDIYNSKIYNYLNIYIKNRKDKKIMFDVLDTNKYPSIHQNINMNKHIIIDDIAISCHVNTQVFDLPKDDFMNIISAESDQDIYPINNNITPPKIKSHSDDAIYKVRKNTIGINKVKIVNNFLE